MSKLKLAVVSMIVIILTGISIFFLIHSNKHKSEESFNNDFKLGVIETTEQDNESYITFYDEELNRGAVKEIKLGSMGSSFDLPKTFNKYMYVIPQGLGNKKDLTVIIEYNMETGEYKTYDIKQPCMNSFCVNEKSIYTVNTFNYNSIISWYDKSSENIKTISKEDVYIGRIDLYDDMLYAFGMLKDGDGLKSYLYLIDTSSFKITDTIDITESGISQEYSTKVGDDIYFTSQTEKADMAEQPSNILTKFNIKDKTITNIDLQEEYPFQIIKYKNKLIISHYDLVQGQGNKITIYNPKTGEQQGVTLENNLSQIFIEDDKIYSRDSDYLYVYAIKDTHFELINKVDIHTKKNSNNFFYLSGFFVNEQDTVRN